MLLLTRGQIAQLKTNGSPDNTGKDHCPIVKWFTPNANATWLVTEMVDEDTAFGLCDLGLGFPELGYISLPEINSLKDSGVLVECDFRFDGHFPLSVYTRFARQFRSICTDRKTLESFLNDPKFKE